MPNDCNDISKGLRATLIPPPINMNVINIQQKYKKSIPNNFGNSFILISPNLVFFILEIVR